MMIARVFLLTVSLSLLPMCVGAQSRPTPPAPAFGGRGPIRTIDGALDVIGPVEQVCSGGTTLQVPITRRQEGFSSAAAAGARPPESFESALFTAEQLRQFQDSIGMSRQQRDQVYVRLMAVTAQSMATRMSVAEADTKLRTILEQHPVDLAAASAQMQVLLGIEDKAKAKHFEMLVQLKNLLTAEQVANLNRLLGRCG